MRLAGEGGPEGKRVGAVEERFLRIGNVAGERPARAGARRGAYVGDDEGGKFGSAMFGTPFG